MVAHVSSSEYESIPFVGILFTLTIGLLLAVWPLSPELKWLRPEFSFLLVFYWLNRLPFRLGLIFAWSIGLVFDLVTGEVLCQKALALTVVAYFMINFSAQIKRAGIVGEMFFVFCLMCVYLLLNYWISAMTGSLIWQLDLLLPALATGLCWPLFGHLLSRYYG